MYVTNHQTPQWVITYRPNKFIIIIFCIAALLLSLCCRCNAMQNSCVDMLVFKEFFYGMSRRQLIQYMIEFNAFIPLYSIGRSMVSVHLFPFPSYFLLIKLSFAKWIDKLIDWNPFFILRQQLIPIGKSIHRLHSRSHLLIDMFTSFMFLQIKYNRMEKQIALAALNITHNNFSIWNESRTVNNARMQNIYITFYVIFLSTFFRSFRSSWTAGCQEVKTNKNYRLNSEKEKKNNDFCGI